ncbi:putative toxin-antitoxin system toxin component, PIN family [Candidatus Woesearchaeota archaeon]|nr:putative toxin-antitoxin system toxin component, PIN family [Candidatus Woesearchaeota archaeon]
MIRVVVDTTTLVSAIGWKDSKPRMILDRCVNGELHLLQSPESFSELKEVLERKKFSFIDSLLREEFLALLDALAVWVIPKTPIELCRDKDDNKFLSLAVDGGADCIISSDNGLLSVGNVNNIAIINPDAFLTKFPHEPNKKL